jgi:hypothetical protein
VQERREEKRALIDVESVFESVEGVFLLSLSLKFDATVRP